MSGAQCCQRVLVVLLDQEEHLEPTGRVVHAGEVLDQLDDDRSFVVDGEQDRVEGQFGVGDDQGFLVGHDLEGIALRGTA